MGRTNARGAGNFGAGNEALPEFGLFLERLLGLFLDRLFGLFLDRLLGLSLDRL